MSSTALMGLVDQLQNWELKIASLLIEATMKIGALTGGNIFILIDTPEGRMFSAGKEYLRQAYLESHLIPTPSDVELQVDHGVSSVSRVAHGSHGIGIDSVTSLQTQLSGPVTMQTFIDSHTPPKPDLTSQKRPWPVDDSEIVPKRRKSIDTSEPECWMVDDDDDDVSCLPLVFDQTILKTERETPLAVQLDSLQSTPNTKKTNDQCKTTIQPFSVNSSYCSEDVVTAVNAFVAANKVEAFSLSSGENICHRGSIENRLASSVCYDVGKVLADLKPPELVGAASKNFLIHNFEAWIGQFENLKCHLKTMIPNGNPELGQTCSLLAVLKMAARAAFNNKLKPRKLQNSVNA